MTENPISVMIDYRNKIVVPTIKYVYCWILLLWEFKEKCLFSFVVNSSALIERMTAVKPVSVPLIYSIDFVALCMKRLASLLVYITIFLYYSILTIELWHQIYTVLMVLSLIQRFWWFSKRILWHILCDSFILKLGINIWAVSDSFS